MATYTLVQPEAGGIMHVCDDGSGNIYYIAAYGAGIEVVVKKYNIASDTLTDISGATFDSFRYGSDDQSVIAWFDGGLYVGMQAPAGTDEFRIYKWDGIGTQTWTLKDTVVQVAGVLTLDAFMDADGDRIAYTCLVGPTSVTHAFRASADGNTWANQTATQTRELEVYYSAQLGELLAHVDSDPVGTRDTDIHSAGNNWAALNAGATSAGVFLGTGDGRSFYKATGGAGVIRWSTDWDVTNNNIAGAWSVPNQPCIWEILSDTWGIGLATNVNRDEVRIWNPGTLTFDLDGTPSAGNAVIPRPVLWGGYLYVAVAGVGIFIRDTPIGPVAVVAYSVSQPAQGMDVSADDEYLHVGVLLATLPILLRLPSDLSADPTVVFNPGVGTAIGVQCGRQHDDWVWIFGYFGGSDFVQLSDDDGATWAARDPGSWAGVAFPCVLGPDDDGRLLLPTDGDSALHETLDAGVAWEDLNAAMPFAIGGMDRLDVNPAEIVIGSRHPRPDRVYYSPNNAGSFEDVSAGTQNAETTQVLVG